MWDASPSLFLKELGGFLLVGTLGGPPPPPIFKREGGRAV